MPADGNVGVAFALVIGAGAATALGASVVFFPKLVKLASPLVLAGSLALAAGVMTYVSLVEILVKSQIHFEEAGHSKEKAYVFATVCFFSGVIFMLILDMIVEKITGVNHLKEASQATDSTDEGGSAAPYNAEDPMRQLKEMQGMAAAMDQQENENKETEECDEEVPEPQNANNAATNELLAKQEEERRKMVHVMGINTAIAIGLHNFPEGLATFVPALSDPAVGAVLAIAIGIHNIPEGLCVALPIYYATGNRLRAFGYALISGSAEPLAGLLGWAILANSFSDGLYATLFGMVSGMMVVVSIRELIPMAHKFDPQDKVVTFSFLGGAAVMALSLVMFVV